MKLLLFLFLASDLTAIAQTAADGQAVHRMPLRFSDAMNKHDGHELAKIMADDVDFVTVGAMWLHGRSDFGKYHARLLNGRFRQATIMPLQIAVRFLTPNIAVVHWSWRIVGDRNADATQRQPRYGMMTIVAEKASGTWLVMAAQNNNSIRDTPPEAQGIDLPMPIPGPGAKTH